METWSTAPSATDNGIHAPEHSERVRAAKYTGNQPVPRAPAFDPPLSKFRTRPTRPQSRPADHLGPRTRKLPAHKYPPRHGARFSPRTSSSRPLRLAPLHPLIRLSKVLDPSDETFPSLPLHFLSQTHLAPDRLNRNSLPPHRLAVLLHPSRFPRHVSHPPLTLSATFPPQHTQINPIVGSIEFDVDPDQAGWYEDWRRIARQRPSHSRKVF